MTGGRIRRIRKYVGDEPFMMTYGDGVCDVDIKRLLEFHKEHGKIATITAVRQEQQKGVLDIGPDYAVKSFREKSVQDTIPINAGYRGGNGDYKRLSPNEVGILMFDWICRKYDAAGCMPKKPVFMKTIVTTSLGEKIAEKYGIRNINTLTGFKRKLIDFL